MILGNLRSVEVIFDNLRGVRGLQLFVARQCRHHRAEISWKPQIVIVEIRDDLSASLMQCGIARRAYPFVPALEVAEARVGEVRFYDFASVVFAAVVYDQTFPILIILLLYALNCATDNVRAIPRWHNDADEGRRFGRGNSRLGLLFDEPRQ